MPALTIGRHAIVSGRYYNPLKEVWGFRLGPSSRRLQDLARAVSSVNREAEAHLSPAGDWTRRVMTP